MAASPEDLTGGEPFSPSVFLDLPPTPRPHGEGEEDTALPDDLVLPVISRMLMEDADEDEYPDHRSLLQAQQPFAQILSGATASSSSGATATYYGSDPASAAAAAGTVTNANGAFCVPLSSSPSPAALADATWPYDPEELSRLLLSRTCCPDMGVGPAGAFTAGDAANARLHQSPGLLDMDGAENTTTLFSGQKNRVNMEMLNMAFLKGMEEANKFLPTNGNLLIQTEPVSMNDLPRASITASQVKKGAADGIRITSLFQGSGNGRSHENRRTWDGDMEAETSRKSKLMAPEPEENGEAVDRMIVDGYDMCMEKMKALRIARIAEAVDNNNTRKGTNAKNTNEAAVDLPALLIHCAQAMSMGTHQAATTELLRQIKRRSSPRGDATQRLAQYFAEGLEARLAGSGSQVYRSLMANPDSVVEYFRAYQLYLTACCFETMAYKFSGMAICRAIVGRKKKVHIVDYGVQYGFQWPSLMAYMATWEGGPPEVRITGVGLPQPGFRPSARIEETGRRLSNCARELGVPFEFRSIVARWETVHASDLRIDPDEVLIVNSITGLGNVMDEGVDGDIDSPSPRDVVLGNIREMRPDVFILCVVNGSYGGPFFVSRFREALFYYSAMFDMLDGTAPLDDSQRLVVERDLIGRCALNVIACEGSERVERPETYKQWQIRSQRAGLKQLPLCPGMVMRLRAKVKKYYHRDFVIDVDRQWLLQGWKGRILYAMSTWIANDTAL